MTFGRFIIMNMIAMQDDLLIVHSFIILPERKDISGFTVYNFKFIYCTFLIVIQYRYNLIYLYFYLP